MNPSPALQYALIAMAVGIAIASAIVGVWWTFAGMMALILSQLLSLRKRRRGALRK